MRHPRKTSQTHRAVQLCNCATVQLCGCKAKMSSAPANRLQETLYVYGARWCPYCVKAKGMLQKAAKSGWRAKYIDIEDRSAAPKAAETAKHRVQLQRVKTIPAVFVGARYLGGSENLAKFLQHSFATRKKSRSRKSRAVASCSSFREKSRRRTRRGSMHRRPKQRRP